MAPRKLSILLFLSLSLALVLSSCLPLPFTGGNRVLSPDDVRATVQTGIEQTLTAQRRIQDATAAAGAVANIQPTSPLVHTETAAATEEVSEIPVAGSTQAETPEAIVEVTDTPEVVPTQTATHTTTYTVTSTSTPTDIPATSTPTPTDTPEPSPTPFDPNITPTSTPPPTITPQGFQAPPDTPVPPTLAPTDTPAATPTTEPTLEPEPDTADLVRLQVETATYCRSGPGRSYDLLDALLPEEWARVIGRSLSEKYYVIETPRGTNNCWLWARYAEVDGDIESLAYLDAAEAPALPEYTHSEDAVCRTGPEEDQPMMATLRGGTTAEIIGRTEMDTWLLVRIPFRWVTCWVPGEDAQLTGNLQAAPVLGAQLPISGGNPVEITATPQATVEAPTAAQPPAAQPVLTPVAGLACRIMSQSPSTNTTISPNASFEASWTIRNIGSETWESNMVDIHYLAGNRIHRSPDRFDLPRSMFTGESVTIKLQMVAPGNPGRYTINWAMSSEDNTFCAMPMTLEVR